MPVSPLSVAFFDLHVYVGFVMLRIKVHDVSSPSF